MHVLLADPFVAELIDRALSPYRDVVGDTELSWMRERLAEQIVQDPNLRGLLSAAYPRTVEGSGERLTAWLGALTDLAAKRERA